ncbi:MAG: TolC family protein [Candidatus Hydrogenedentota bacterium]
MIKRALSIVLAVMASAGPGLTAQESLTFEQAVNRVRARNEAIKAAHAQVSEADAERKAARGLRYPEVGVVFRHYFLDDPIVIGLDVAFLSLDFPVQRDEFWEGQLQFQWPLYTGGRINAANEAAAGQQAEVQADLRQTEHGLITELAERYYGVVLASRAKEVQALKVQVMEAHEKRARRLFDEGIIARIEYLNVQVAVSEARVALEEAQRQVAIVGEALANTVAAAEPPTPVSRLFLLPEIAPLDTFRGMVNASHPVLAKLDAKGDQAEQGVRAAKGELKPTVYAFGQRELVPGHLTMLDPEWAAGVGVEYKLFQGGRRSAKVSAAKAVTERVGHLREKYARDLETLVVKRYQELHQARERYRGLEKTLELTDENLRVRTRAFEEGVATSVEVVDATLSHARAQLGRFKAAFDYDVAFFQLLEASGRSAAWKAHLAHAEPIPEHANDMAPDAAPDAVPAQAVFPTME